MLKKRRRSETMVNCMREGDARGAQSISPCDGPTATTPPCAAGPAMVETPGGGMHVDGFLQGITKQVRKAIEDNARKLKVNLKDSHMKVERDGISPVWWPSSRPHRRTAVQGQTKDVLGTAQVQPIVSRMTDKQFGEMIFRLQTRLQGTVRPRAGENRRRNACPRARRARPRKSHAVRTRLNPRPCRRNCPTASPAMTMWPNCSSSRVIPHWAQPRPPVIPVSKRCCQFEAKSSTCRRHRSRRCCPTRNAQPSSSWSAQDPAQASTSNRPDTTRSS